MIYTHLILKKSLAVLDNRVRNSQRIFHFLAFVDVKNIAKVVLLSVSVLSSLLTVLFQLSSATLLTTFMGCKRNFLTLLDIHEKQL